MDDNHDLVEGEPFQEDEQPKHLCRSTFLRPLPQGKRVYFVLFQSMLLNIIGEIVQIFFQFLLFKHFKNNVLSVFKMLETISLMLCLPMGFIADRYFGRAKVLYYSWILLFVAQLIFTVFYTVTALASHKIPVVNYIVVISTFLLHCIGIAGVRVNLIPFGADQLRTASSDELSSYFHWYYWCRNIGGFFVYSVGILLIVAVEVEAIPLLVSSIAATFGVVINILGYKWFIKREKVGNPLLLICRVLRYAATKKRPAERSAFSFDDRYEPSRIDLAKQTHYGIFRDEQVEDVKTFLRILVLLVALIGFFCVYPLLKTAYIEQAAYSQQPKQFCHEVKYQCNNSMQNKTSVTVHQCHGLYSLLWTVLINITAILLLIPILDRIIYPLCCPWMPKMLTRIGVGMLACLTSILCAISMEGVCYHNFQSPSSKLSPHINLFHSLAVFSVSKISIWVLAPQFLIQGIAECLVFIAMVEFIYAQSPVYMKGLLLGCFFFIQGIAEALGLLMFLSQSKGNKYWENFRVIHNYYNTTYTTNHTRWCDIPQYEINSGSGLAAYTLTIIIVMFGILLFLYSARKYRIRIRGNTHKYFLQFT